MSNLYKTGLRKSKCSVIILTDKQNRVLLYLRDENPTIPFPQAWALIGGAPENSENPEDAVRREVIEELGLLNGEDYKISKIKFLFSYKRSDISKTEYVFHSVLPYDLKELVLKEGRRLALFNIAQIKGSDEIAPHHKEILLKYYQSPL